LANHLWLDRHSNLKLGATTEGRSGVLRSHSKKYLGSKAWNEKIYNFMEFYAIMPSLEGSGLNNRNLMEFSMGKMS
jgi:hypothetical protein